MEISNELAKIKELLKSKEDELSAALNKVKEGETSVNNLQVSSVSFYYFSFALVNYLMLS